MKAASITEPYHFMLFGEPGVGKTVLAAEADNACHLSIDRGGHISLLNHEKTKNVRSLRPDNFDDIKKFAAACKAGKLETLYRRIYPGYSGEFKTAILDSFSAARDLELREQLGDSDRTHQDIWTKNNRRLNRLLEDMFAGPYNVIVICHVKEDKDEGGQTVLTRPDLSGGLTSQVLRHLDGVFYLKKTGNSRILQIQPQTQKVTSKNRYGGLPSELTNPSWLKIEQAINNWRQQHAEDRTGHESGGDSGGGLPTDDSVGDLPGTEGGSEREGE